MLFALSNEADTSAQRQLRGACYHALQKISELKESFISLPCDPFTAVDPLDPATRFGSLVFAAQALSRVGMLPGPDAETFWTVLEQPNQSKSIVAFFTRGQDERQRESRIQEIAKVIRPVLRSLPGFEMDQASPGSRLSPEGRQALQAVFPLLRELTFEMRKPAALLERMGEVDDASAKIHARFEASSLSGVDMKALEALFAPSCPEKQPEASPEYDL